VGDLGNAVTVAPPGDLDGFARWIGGLGALVGNDTAAIHLAAAMGTPVVSLHLATDGRVWRPVGERVRPLQSALALRCRAMKRDGTCTRLYRGCPAPCRAGVTPEQVVAAVDDLRVEREDRWSTRGTSSATR
jgi:heptosyltransferase-3